MKKEKQKAFLKELENDIYKQCGILEDQRKNNDDINSIEFVFSLNKSVS